MICLAFSDFFVIVNDEKNAIASMKVIINEKEIRAPLSDGN